MKSNSLRSSVFRPTAFSAVLLLSLTGTGLHAAGNENIFSAKDGASVVYSTPLAKGASPDSLVDGDHSVSFSKKGSHHVIVIDLGKTYHLNNIQLKFSKSANIQVFVLQNKPTAGQSWNDLINGTQPTGVLQSSNDPAPLGGARGEFLVLSCDRDPGRFSGLFVTGDPAAFGNGVADFNQGSGALSETPLPAGDYIAPSGGGGTASGSSPNVPPQSN